MMRGKAIATIRIELGLSLREVAAASGLTHVHLSSIERDSAGHVAAPLEQSIYFAMANLVLPRALERAADFTAKMGLRDE